MNKILIILQLLLKASLIFLISFIWLRYFLERLWLILTLSFAITGVILLLSSAYLRRKNKKNHLKQKERKDAEDMFLSLSYDDKYISFFEALVQVRHKNIKSKKQYILITHEDKSKTILFPFLKFRQISIDDINAIIFSTTKDSPDKIVVCCNDFDRKILSYIKNLHVEVTIIDKYETYLLLYKEYDFFPKITMTASNEKKLSFKELIAYSFNRSRTKGYLLSALFIFFTSFFVQINIYYCIFSSLLLVLALISYINPKYNPSLKNELL